MVNRSIKCDVFDCVHNIEGTSCNLNCIKVTCSCGGEKKTCCESFCPQD